MSPGNIAGRQDARPLELDASVSLCRESYRRAASAKCEQRYVRKVKLRGTCPGTAPALQPVNRCEGQRLSFRYTW